jgi:UDP-N-acetylmuramoyl-tripeptide--D-alanyl-D-alanine ligase
LFDEHGRLQPGRVTFGITGSNGKTTTKEALGAILVQAFPGQVCVSPGNLNSQIGLAMVLAGLTGDERYVVLELGISRLGDMADLVAMAPVQRALVTSIAAAHLEGLGLDEQAVAAEKGGIFRGSPMPEVAIVPEQWSASPLVPATMGDRLRVFGAGSRCQARLMGYIAGEPSRLDVALSPPVAAHPEAVTLTLRLLGAHNAHNVLGAVAAVWDLLPAGDAARLVQLALAGLGPMAGRLQWRAGRRGSWVLDDAYNANPGSLRAALAVFAQRRGQRWAILGDMLELGSEAARHHREAGLAAAQAGCTRIWAVGQYAETVLDGARQGGVAELAAFASAPSCAAALEGALAPGDVILVKGSRGVKLDQVVEALVESGASPGLVVANGTGDGLSSGRA